MRAVDIIVKKRNMQELSNEEIVYFVNGFTCGEIPDYQAAAWAMAVLLNGMTERETTDLTLAMAHSGEILDLSPIAAIVVDKHSTGGVGDKTTLVVEPLVAACGLKVGKMSGRGLGFSGGTIDKLESIPGFRVDLSTDEFKQQMKDIGLALTGQSADLAPADGKLYALRDVTGTVQSIPLIASSVMSKKIAAGANVILLDVKVGLGAFMHTLDDAQKLARLMVSIAHLVGRKAQAVISDMNQPLGKAVGNALEVKEAVLTLQGKGPEDFWQHCLEVSARLLVMAGQVDTMDAGRVMAMQAISTGAAWEKFQLLIRAQGGDLRVIQNLDLLPKADFIETISAEREGYLQLIDARLVGKAAVLLGGGRTKKDDPIDHAVGIEVLQKVGNKVAIGEPLFVVHANRETDLAIVKEQLLQALAWSPTPTLPLPLFYGLVE